MKLCLRQEGESIATIEHLRNAATNDNSWKKITSVKHSVKQMIHDYTQLSVTSHTHMMMMERRTQVNKLETEARADRDKVEAFERGLQNTFFKKKEIDGEVKDLLEGLASSKTTKQLFDKHDERKRKVELIEKELKETQIRLQQAQTQLSAHRAPIRVLETKIAEDDERIRNLDAILKIDIADVHRKLNVKDGRGLLLYGPPATETQIRLQQAQTQLSTHRAPIRELETKIAEDDERIRNLDAILKIDIADVHRKLNVKYGRGLLLYGPPGTGINDY
ncbi:unnamed protein product [Rotaria sordida]|uniref:Uncharacterized protein n=1 Tax=Rotaria sordida TaxID=392033 RepID=A0A815UNT2_9BILA|nr:unnamed protein product [Rotaria sordida]